MTALVVLAGALIAATGVFGMVWPRALSTLMLGWSPTVLLGTAVGVRVALGVIFLLAAPRCRFPRAMYALGCLALGAAAVVTLLGGGHLEAVVRWWASQPEVVVRSTYALPVLFGGFLAYSGSRRP